MGELVKVHLNLSGPQVKKLVKGQGIRVAHKHLGSGEHFVHLHPHKAKKVHKAIKNQKGAVISLSPVELEHTMEGGGFGDFINKLKNAGKFLKEKIIDTNFYQQNVKPLVRGAVDEGLKLAKPYLGQTANLAEQGVNALGSTTNAFGLPKKKAAKKRVSVKKSVVVSPVTERRDELKDFVVESMMMPVPGQPGFTSLPMSSQGNGVHHTSHHHYYYPVDHSHMKRKNVKKHEMVGSSFRLA